MTSLYSLNVGQTDARTQLTYFTGMGALTAAGSKADFFLFRFLSDLAFLRTKLLHAHFWYYYSSNSYPWQHAHVSFARSLSPSLPLFSLLSSVLLLLFVLLLFTSPTERAHNYLFILVCCSSVFFFFFLFFSSFFLLLFFFFCILRFAVAAVVFRFDPFEHLLGIIVWLRLSLCCFSEGISACCG